MVSAFQQGLEDPIATDGGLTIATEINVPGGVGHKAVSRFFYVTGFIAANSCR